ncbi:hypothetical protein MMC22_011863 [Lobaria immixta]|nr:hypothetical protein [Lobaria immixta]
MIHRHGSRYPSVNATVEKYGKNLTKEIQSGRAKFTGKLSFLNTWSYGLGLFESGVLHYYDYGHLVDPSKKLVARTTTQDRMLKSAEYFLAGFFGLDWPKNASLEVIIEQPKFNNSLAGDLNCKNAGTGVATGGTNASVVWQGKYLPKAVQRFQKLSTGFTWNVTSVYYAQALCPYETVAFGYSAFCDLFTYEEWEGFEYVYDLIIDGNYFFQSPIGRALGIGYVEEVLARLEHHFLTTPNTQANITLDSMASTFPLDQKLYFDFSHINTIIGALTAFGLKQFAQFLPTTGPPRNQEVITSYLQPNAGRLDIEVISAPHPIPERRNGATNAYGYGGPTKYVHFILNQRTIPLGVSLKGCGKRDDGWCELETFLKIQSDALADSEFNYACYGNYTAVPYGTLTNGVPQPPTKA